MSEQQKKPAWTMRVLSADEVQALKVQEAQEAERRKAETHQERMEAFYMYGWNDYVESLDREMKPLHPSNTDEEKQRYLDGWNAARAQEEQQGIVSFLLDELLKRMDAGNEWYGTDFDEPIQIVKKIQAAYQAEKENNVH